MADRPRDGWSELNEEFARRAGYDSWEEWVDAREEALGYKVCGARNAADEPCGSRAGAGVEGMLGMGRCARHGGVTRRGRQHQAYKHGRYCEGWSRYLPEGLQDVAREARETDLVEHVEQAVSVLAAKIAQELRRLSRNENPERLREAGDLMGELLDAMDDGDVSRVRAAAAGVHRLAGAAAEEDAGWGRVLDLLDRLRKTCETQSKIMVEQGVYVRIDLVEVRLSQMVGEMRGAVLQNVSDDDEARAVLRDVARTVQLWERQETRSLPPGSRSGSSSRRTA